ncbi:OmpA/MotB family protein [Emticicia fluvialis]|uniref:OmpA/MotB family protein n=1 Tax=Emticicia fluvialis TaxID=2974474 RepID=UPI002165F7AD|nr:OmpA family protein [Emticicia fluvialis]
MKVLVKPLIILFAATSLASCVTKKKYVALQNEYDRSQSNLVKCGDEVQDYKDRLAAATRNAENQNMASQSAIQQRDQQLSYMKDQLEDLKKLRDRQLEQVGDLTVLSRAANANIDNTLSQMQQKDLYINRLHAARTKTDSINLALAVNLTSVLKDGIEDKDIEVKVDKTVVMINISDKMLFNSGSYKITPRANVVLGKIAQIVQSRPELEVMVEGYTDNVSIKNDCITDNWDLSVKRATSVVRTLQGQFKVDPNKLIAAGRGEYNMLTSNDTAEGRSTNRRTRIILMPKLNQFYELLGSTK